MVLFEANVWLSCSLGQRSASQVVTIAPAIYGLSKLIFLDRREGLRDRSGGSAWEYLFVGDLCFPWEVFVGLFVRLVANGKILQS